MNHLNIDNVLARLQCKGALKVAAAVTDIRKITPTLSQVMVTCSSIEDASVQDLTMAIATATEGNAWPIAKSFHRVNNAGLPAFVGFVRANRQVKPYERAAVGKMRELAKNMYMDANDDSLWEVKTAPDGQRMLCRQVNDDLSSLLASVQTSIPRAPKISQLATVVNPGDAIAYIDPRMEIVRHAFVLASEQDPATGDQALDVTIVPEQDDDEPIDMQIKQQEEAFAITIVSSRMVVAAVSLPTRFFSKQVASPGELHGQSQNSLKKLKDYYQKLWGYGPDHKFIDGLMRNIDSLSAI